MRRSFSLVLLLGAGCAGGTTGSSDCPAGTVSQGSTCVTLCNSDAECGPGTICTTGTCLPGNRPEVTAHSPLAGSDDVAADSTIVLTFAVPMEPVSAEGAFLVTSSLGTVAGAIEWNATNLALTFTPTDPMVAGVQYTVQLAQTAMSADGVPLADTFEFSFSIFLPAVAVIESTPAPGSLGIGISPLIEVIFSVPMDPLSARASTVLLDDIQREVAANKNVSTDGTVVTIVPGADLNNDTLYTIHVTAGAESVDGATLQNDYDSTFRTTAQADANPPTVTVDPVAFVISGPDLDGFDSYTFTGTASDVETSIEQVYVQIVTAGSGPGTTWAPAELVGTDWTYRWFPTTVNPLPDGTYALYVRAVDLGANEDTANTVFEADLMPPAAPSFINPVPTAWKFVTLSVDVQSEPDGSLEVLVNNVAEAGSPFSVGASGIANLDLVLATPDTYNLAIFAVDAEGNRNPTPLAHTLSRTAYACLSSSNAFPLPAATLVGGSVLDDGEGNVVVEYVLDSGNADDTDLSNGDTTPNGGRTSNDVGNGDVMLVRFASEFLPDCATIVAAEIILQGQNQGLTVDAHPVLRAWTESDADWIAATASADWVGVGASDASDRGAAVGTASWMVATYPYDATFDLTLTARDWQSGTANHGVLLSSSSCCTSFFTTEYGNDSYQPHLLLRLQEPTQ